MSKKNIGSTFHGFDIQGDLYPPREAALVRISRWGGNETSVLEGALCEIVDKRYGYFEVRPINAIKGWGTAQIFALGSELQPQTMHTAELIGSLDEQLL